MHGRFFDRLIAVYEEHAALLASTNRTWLHANDQAWKALQGPHSAWFAFTTRVGRQRRSFSDNIREELFYGI